MARGKTKTNGGANLGFEATLWSAADKLRGHMNVCLICHPEPVESRVGRDAFPRKSQASFAYTIHRDPAPSGTTYIRANPPFNMSDCGGDRFREDNPGGEDASPLQACPFIPR